MQIVAKVVGSEKEIGYDAGVFTLDGESITLEKVTEYDDLGVLEWADNEARQHVLGIAEPPQSEEDEVGSSPVAPDAADAQAPSDSDQTGWPSSRRSAVVGALVIVVTIAAALFFGRASADTPKIVAMGIANAREKRDTAYLDAHIDYNAVAEDVYNQLVVDAGTMANMPDTYRQKFTDTLVGDKFPISGAGEKSWLTNEDTQLSEDRSGSSATVGFSRGEKWLSLAFEQRGSTWVVVGVPDAARVMEGAWAGMVTGAREVVSELEAAEASATAKAEADAKAQAVVEAAAAAKAQAEAEAAVQAEAAAKAEELDRTTVTMDEYNAVQNGMNLKQVTAIIGWEGEQTSSTNVAGYSGESPSVAELQRLEHDVHLHERTSPEQGAIRA